MDKLFSSQKVLPQFRPLPKYPSIERDIAIILSDNVHAREFQDFIWGLKPSYLESLKIFDLYKGKSIPKGEKSMGLRFTYRSIDHTLSENEVTPVHESLVKAVLEKYKASLRS
jgi:phenylalanyl-tRNA synthetase beta chain